MLLGTFRYNHAMLCHLIAAIAHIHTGNSAVPNYRYLHPQYIHATRILQGSYTSVTTLLQHRAENTHQDQVFYLKNREWVRCVPNIVA
jgi:hypothetical protein